METVSQELPLHERWRALRAEEPGLRARDAAARLGVSEGELVAAQVGTDTIRLTNQWDDILHELPKVGTIMGLTRNEHCVIEKTGVFEHVEVNGHMGLVLGEAIDMRVFLWRWHAGFARREETKQGVRRSLQFFDEAGTAIHKIYSRDTTDIGAFEALVERFRAEDQSPKLEVLEPAGPSEEKPDEEIDRETLLGGWASMEDTHDFVHLLRRAKVTRTQALRLACPTWAEPVSLASYRQVLETARETELPIMVFVGNRGNIQIHTGPVKKLKVVGEWFNVLDPDFNLHLRESGAVSAWVVKKPTVDGLVTSVELFDARGDNVAMFFGKRKPGLPELEGWRELVAKLERIPPAADRFAQPPAGA